MRGELGQVVVVCATPPNRNPIREEKKEGDPGRDGRQGTRPHAGQLGGPASRGLPNHRNPLALTQRSRTRRRLFSSSFVRAVSVLRTRGEQTIGNRSIKGRDSQRS
eukprot:2103229-Pyramimonas_sp.AAC.1